MNLSLDFAFEGFRLIRHRPQVVLFWGLVSLLGNGIGMVVFIAMTGDAMAGLQASNSDPAAAMALMGKLLPAYGVLLPMAMISQAVISCAVFREVLGPQSSGFGGLRLGGDELRQILLGFLFILVFLGLEIVVLIPAAFIAGVLSVALTAISPALGTLGFVAGIAVGGGVLIWVVLRLSLCSAQTFAQRKINLFGSWKLTKGNSWNLLVGYIVAMIMALLVWGLCIGIFMAIVVAINQGNMTAMSPVFTMTNGGGVAALANPVVAVYLILMNMVVTPLLIAISVGAPAAAYKILSGTSNQAETVF